MTPRVVTLIASATEIVCALGCEELLVGRSHECDFPPTIVSLPPCSAPRIDVHASSQTIDDQVKSLLASALSIYDVDAALLDRLRPHVIITQTQCAVCAVSLSDVEQALGDVVATRPEVVSLHPERLADVWADIRTVANALGVLERGDALTSHLHSRIARLRQSIVRESERPRVACIEWLDPLMAAGNWVPELVELAGGRNVLGRAGQHSPWMSWDELAAADPDVIVLLPCGLDIRRTRQELPEVASHSAWSALRAVRGGRVAIADGNQYFNRPGPRLVESAEILAEILHPRTADFGHRGHGWEPL